MRDAINNNPVVQLVVLGVLLVAVGVVVAGGMLGGGAEEEASAPATSTAAGTTAAGVASPGTPATSTGLPSIAAPSTGAPAPTGTVSPAALKPGPGLPAELIGAWKDGQAVVLLIVRGGGTDDRLVRASVARLSGDEGLAVFVVRAKDIARYSRVTQGVGVSRVPALVVMRPQKVSGSIPEGIVSYGFRNSQSVVQAVQDALYSGNDNIPYHPQ